MQVREYDWNECSDKNGTPNTRSSTFVVTHLFVATIWSQIVFEFVLEEFPRAQTDVATRVIVHALVQVEHDFVLFVSLVAPATIHDNNNLIIHNITIAYTEFKLTVKQ